MELSLPNLYTGNTAVQGEFEKEIFEKPLLFSYAEDAVFNYQAIPLTTRVIGLWKIVPLAVATVAQLAKAIFYAPLAIASTKTDIVMGEMYKVAWLAQRTFAHIIAPFYNCDEKAQRLDCAARFSANCEQVRCEKYEQVTVTAKEYLEAPERLQKHYEARFGLTDGFYYSIKETDVSFLDGITLDWDPREVITTITRRENKVAIQAPITARVSTAMVGTPATPRRTSVYERARAFDTPVPSPARSSTSGSPPLTPFDMYFIPNPDSKPPSAKK